MNNLSEFIKCVEKIQRSNLFDVHFKNLPGIDLSLLAFRLEKEYDGSRIFGVLSIYETENGDVKKLLPSMNGSDITINYYNGKGEISTTETYTNCMVENANIVFDWGSEISLAIWKIRFLFKYC